jgi:hypothetical protein
VNITKRNRLRNSMTAQGRDDLRELLEYILDHP